MVADGKPGPIPGLAVGVRDGPPSASSRHLHTDAVLETSDVNTIRATADGTRLPALPGRLT